MFVKPARLFIVAILITLVVFPTMPAVASNAKLAAGQGNLLSDGQFVYGPNVGSFNVQAYLDTHAAHLAPYADDLYGRAKYYSINPKIYLTLLEVHAHLVSRPNLSAMDDPFGLGGDFMAQIDLLSNKMKAAYYTHLYNYSALPVADRTLAPFATTDGGSVKVASATNAGTYALIAGLTAIDAQNISVMLDNSRVDGFYQTYQRLFENDDPLDGQNQINIPGTASALAAPPTLLQLPFLRGLTWRFGGVHDTSGCSGLGSNGCQFTDASAMDFYPSGSTWGMDTSSMWVVAAAAGTPTRVSSCYFTVTYANGWETSYYHLENTQTFTGQVKQNDKIGVIANTEAEATCNGGAASGPHVHFWLRHNGADVAINGTALSGWTVHAGRWSYDNDPNYMWVEKAGVRKHPWNGDTLLSQATPLIFKATSIAAQDGWALESAEGSKLGGSINAAAATLRLGDDAGKRQYVGILSFNTSALPDTAVITAVTLKLKKQGVTGGGDPLTAFQGFMVDIRKGTFGTAALQVSDFQSVTSRSVGPAKPALISGFYNINLNTGKASINKLSTNSGLTQIRLRFKLDDNNNTVANYLSLYSGNTPTAADRPQLVVTYYLP